MTPAHAFHAAACRRIGVDPEARGARAAVAEHLGIAWQSYTRSLDRGSLDTLARWAGRLGIRVIVEPDGSVAYEVTL